MATKQIFRRIITKLRGRKARAESKSLDHALEYIDDYWQQLIRDNPDDIDTLIGLPHPFVVPAAHPDAAFKFEEQFYWDSYFVALGLVGGKYQYLAEGMLENLLHLYKRFGFIPNASRMYFMTHSQPPILTSYIRLIYETGNKDKAWLQQRMKIAKDEYVKVWTAKKHPFWHNVYKGLSRYYDIHVLHDLAEAESGWDMTPRFERKCLDYLPIDLNSLLYKYETDFAWAASLAGETDEVKLWHDAAARRKREMAKLMWHNRRGFFFDYNYVKGQPGDSWSLAGFYPLWAELATAEQAARVVKNLVKFQQTGGLATTTRPLIDMSIFGSLKTQWAYPNGWAPLQWIVVQGLKNYGYHDEAAMVARTWVHTNLAWYQRHHVFLEKYNVVNPHKPPVEGVYPSQTGFGWTNAIFKILAEEYGLQD